MSDLVSYDLDEGIATVTMDDGKANLMALPMIEALWQAFDRAEADRAVTVLTGRSQVFSAGYDMAVFDQPAEVILATMRAGGDLILRILSHPLPVVAACNGHAIAQGAFTLLACDERIGVEADVKIGLNEVAIGLTIPHYGIELARHQLAAPWFDHATVTGRLYSAPQAMRAGFLHEIVAPAALAHAAREHALRLARLDLSAHEGTKQRVRRHALTAISDGIASELATASAGRP